MHEMFFANKRSQRSLFEAFIYHRNLTIVFTTEK